MRYSRNTPAYEIDLELDESERWSEIIDAERQTMKKMARASRRQLKPHRYAVTLLGPLFTAMYSLWGGRYINEIKALSEAMGFTSTEGLVLNCQYELSHAADCVGGMLSIVRLGCTGGIRHIPSLGMVHVRSMDWPIPEIGNATRIIWFRRGKRRFASVHILGFVGVLSGMLPHRYSVTINWLPAQRRPTFQFGPAFLLREVLERCDTYSEAVRWLRDSEVSTAVSYSVCGAKAGEACVIEHTGSDVSVRKLKSGTLVQANHFNSRRLATCNKCILESEDEEYMSMYEDSTTRQSALEDRLAAMPNGVRLYEVGRCISKTPVRVDDSYQQMVFCPTTGELIVWRKVK